MRRRAFVLRHFSPRPPPNHPPAGSFESTAPKRERARQGVTTSHQHARRSRPHKWSNPSLRVESIQMADARKTKNAAHEHEHEHEQAHEHEHELDAERNVEREARRRTALAQIRQYPDPV